MHGFAWNFLPPPGPEIWVVATASLFLGWIVGKAFAEAKDRNRIHQLLRIARARLHGESQQRFPTDDSPIGLLMKVVNQDLDRNVIPIQDVQERMSALSEQIQALLRINETLLRSSGEAAQAVHEVRQQNEELEKLVRHLRHLAATDGLTGLANHRTFGEELAQAFAYARRYHADLSLLMLDLDHFKEFNDRHGHQAGDGALRDIATILKSVTRAADLCARYGGEEFAVVLPSTDLDGAIQLAERIRAEVRKHEEQPHDFTVSIGVATLDETIGSPEALVELADRCLYLAKSRGRDRVVAMQAEERRKGA
jgi:diguanylate cyclase (GGDEF)-like protein